MDLYIRDTEQETPLLMRTLSAVPTTYVELYTSLPLNKGHLSIQDSQLGPNGVLYREVPLYTGQPAGSQLGPSCVLYREVPLTVLLCLRYRQTSPLSSISVSL